VIKHRIIFCELYFEFWRRAYARAARFPDPNYLADLPDAIQCARAPPNPPPVASAECRAIIPPIPPPVPLVRATACTRDSARCRATAARTAASAHTAAAGRAERYAGSTTSRRRRVVRKRSSPRLAYNMAANGHNTARRDAFSHVGELSNIPSIASEQHFVRRPYRQCARPPLLELVGRHMAARKHVPKRSCTRRDRAPASRACAGAIRLERAYADTSAH